jgi:pimeloyl-ACP methyl ester carboxylesterase
MPSSTSRPTVLLVHGFPGGSTDFGLLVDELVTRGWDRDQVLTPDLVGFGALAGDHTFDELWVPAQAARLEGALAGAGEVVLVGHDIGGPIALAVADRLGSRVRGLVVASCNLLRDPPLPGPFGLLSVPVLGRLVESAAFSRTSLRAMGRFGRRSGRSPRRNTATEAQAIHTIFATALHDPAVHFGPIQSLLEGYPGPLTLVTGDRDPFFTVGHARRQAALARTSRLVVLPGTGHFPQLEAPRALAELVDAAAVTPC